MVFASGSRAEPPTDVERWVGESRFRSLVALIDRLVLILGALALLTGLLAILGSPYTIYGGSIYRGDGNDHELQRWQLMALLVVFSGLVASNFTQHRRVRRVTSLLALGLAVVASVAWWWAASDGLLTRTYVSVIDIALGGGMILTGFSFGLQIAVGLLMFTSAFPLAAQSLGDDPP